MFFNMSQSNSKRLALVWPAAVTLSIALSTYVTLLLVGCSGLQRSPVAHVSPDPQHGYAIRIDFAYRAASVCEFPPRTHQQTGSAWIFVDTTNGVVAADQLTLWHGKSPRDDYGWAQKALLGSVVFTNGYMRVAFEVPEYRDDGSIRRHKPFLWNGNYRLE